MIVLLLSGLIATILGGRTDNCLQGVEMEYVGNLLLLETPREVALLLKENPADRNEKLLEFVLDNRHLKVREDPFDAYSEKLVENTEEISLETRLDVRERLEGISVYLSDFLGEHQGFLEKRNIDDVKLSVYAQEDFEASAKENVLHEIEEDYKRAIAKCKEILIAHNNANDKNIPSKLNTRGNADPQLDGDKYELTFQRIPKGENYKVRDVGIQPEFVEYSIFSKLVGFLHPTEFPLKLLQDSINKNLPLHILVLQVIKLEGLVLCWIIFWGMVSLCLPLAILTQLCCSKANRHRLPEEPLTEGNCTHRCAVLLLYIVMLSLLGCILLMLGSNDRFSRTVEKLPYTAGIILSDVETFIKNSHLQMNFATATAFEQVAERIHQDLKGKNLTDADKLLGVQFREDLEKETRLKAAIRGLKDLKSDSAGISRRVRELLWECGMARKSVRALQEALDEVSRQLNSAKKYCQQKDRSLCESLQTAGLTLALNIDEIVANPTLQYFERIYHNNDFNSSIDEIVISYEDIPRFVLTETTFERAAIYDILQKHRRHVYASLRSLEDLSRSLTSGLKENSKDVTAVMEEVASKDLWRYLAVVGTTFIIFAIWASFVCGSPCGCHVVTKTVPFLSFGMLLMSLAVLIVWVFGSASFVFGGHGQTIVCNRLYEDNFKTLSTVFDENGILYEEGLFRHVLNANETLRIEDVLRNCERNHTSYQTFRLENRLDINKIMNFKSWSDFRAILDGIKIDTRSIKLRSDSLEASLEEYTRTNKLRELRSKISLPVTHRELITFKQQIFSVTKQISNSKSANTYQKIILRVEEIIQKEYATVKNFRDSVLFKLTAIEILYQPLREKSDNSLQHLKDAHQVLEKRGKEIADRNIKKYIFRFDRYLNDLQRYTIEQLRRNTAKCRPLWDIFDFARHQACNLLVDPLSALSFSYFITTITFIMITPIIIHLINVYRSADDRESTLQSTYRRYSASINQDQSIWATPQSGSPPNGSIVDQRNETRRNTHGTENNWTTSRPHIPSPPRLPSLPMAPSPIPPMAPSSASSSTTNKTVPRLSTFFAKTKLITKPLKNKYDSLKYIERISKSPRPGQSPRGWL